MYLVIFHKKAEDQLKKLEKDIQIRIINVLERIKTRPHYFVKRLVGRPYYRLRIGDYRVILDIKQDKLLILVLELGHRKNIYS